MPQQRSALKTAPKCHPLASRGKADRAIYIEIRNGAAYPSLEHRSRAMEAKGGAGSTAGAKNASSDYVFDFDDGTRRPAKRPRAR